MLFVYSGNFSCEAEKDQFNQTRLLLGLNEELFSYPLAAGETFTVPESHFILFGRWIVCIVAAVS